MWRCFCNFIWQEQLVLLHINCLETSQGWQAHRSPALEHVRFIIITFPGQPHTDGSVCEYVCSVAQSCPTLCDPVDCSPPGSSVHGISQARILEWVAMPSSRGSSPPRDRTHLCCIPCIGRQILYHCTTWKHMDPAWDIPFSFGPDSFADAGVNGYIWGCLLANFGIPLNALGGMVLGAHSTDVLVNVDGVFSGHHLVDSGPALLLSTLLCKSPFCRAGVQDYGRRNMIS